MYDADATPGSAKDIGMHEELTIFLKRTNERLERELSVADQAEAHAKMARHRAEQTRRVYEATAKLHDSMANQPADYPGTVDPNSIGIAGGSGRGWS